MDTKDYIRPTVLVRSIMRKFGVPGYMMYTNSYDKCRTVKCYRLNGMNISDLYDEVYEQLEKAGVRDFDIKMGDSWAHEGYGMPGSFIVRIPRTVQP